MKKIIDAYAYTGPCACLGPRPGDPYCPCSMRQRGLPVSDPWTAEKQADMEAKLTKAFGKGLHEKDN